MNYADDYNPILEYYQEIKTGKATVSEKIRKTYKKLAYDCEHPDQFFYSNKRANHILTFFESCCYNFQGKEGGKKVVLELWEKAMLAAVFGFIDINGLRKYQRAILIVGKKNGKSLLASGVGNYMLIADSEPGPEVYAVATKRDQAKIIWMNSKRMVNKSPMLRRRVKPLVGELSSEEFNNGTYKPLSSDENTLDGLNVHCALMDEIHQWKNGKALYDIIANGTTAREQPLVFITSTAGTVREDIYDFVYDEAERIINGYFDPEGYKDERTICFIYELDDRKEWTDPACWKKANPGLGTIKSLSQLEAKVEKAKQNHLLVKDLICKEFNIRETSTEAWLTFDQLNNKATYELEKLKPRYAIGGVDLSRREDLTCATILFLVKNDPTIYVKQMYWIPADLLESHIREDRIPYDLWVDQGLVRLCSGNQIREEDVVEWFKEMQSEKDIYLYKVGYDSWSSSHFVALMENEFGQPVMVPVIQGKKTLSLPMYSLAADLEKKLVNYNNNPVLKWCLTNTTVDIDKNANIQPAKVRAATRRIDGTASLLDAYTVYLDNRDDYLTYIDR